MSDAASQAQATIQTEWADDILILKPVGRIDSNNAAAAEEIIVGHIEKGAQRLAFDMGALDYISSAGLRVLLVTAKKLRQTGGRIALYELQPAVHEVLEVSGFLAILPVVEDRDAALAKV